MRKKLKKKISLLEEKRIKRTKKGKNIYKNIILKIKRKSEGRKKKMKNTKNNQLRESKGITLIALVITILFSYDEKIKCSNSKGFLLTTIL